MISRLNHEPRTTTRAAGWTAGDVEPSAAASPTPPTAATLTFVEAVLVLVTLGIVILVHLLAAQHAVVLNLFFLPIVLAGFFLGQYRAGVLALFAVISTSVVLVANLPSAASTLHPLVVLLQLCVWGATLGLTAVLVGTLSDDRSAKAVQAREAHRGVAEVLGAYLQSVNPNLKSRAIRVCQLAENMGRKLRLSPGDLDDIRVASLLLDLEPLEITSRVIRRAVGEYQDEVEPRTLAGSDLVQSLGLVLTTAFPIAQCAAHRARWRGQTTDDFTPLGADILRAARAYDQLSMNPVRAARLSPLELVDEVAKDDALALPPIVLTTLQSCVAEWSTNDLFPVVRSGEHVGLFVGS